MLCSYAILCNIFRCYAKREREGKKLQRWEKRKKYHKNWFSKTLSSPIMVLGSGLLQANSQNMTHWHANLMLLRFEMVSQNQYRVKISKQWVFLERKNSHIERFDIDGDKVWGACWSFVSSISAHACNQKTYTIFPGICEWMERLAGGADGLCAKNSEGGCHCAELRAKKKLRSTRAVIDGKCCGKRIRWLGYRRRVNGAGWGGVDACQTVNTAQQNDKRKIHEKCVCMNKTLSPQSSFKTGRSSMRTQSSSPSSWGSIKEMAVLEFLI